jgi:crotonobetainyl-CoA:carnitine CoA-transferase CaiB-like acyl-CoA transferase
VATVADLGTSPQLLAREFFQRLDHPDAGTAIYPGAPFTIQGTAWHQARAPRLGEHNVEVYCDYLGYTREDLAHLRAAGVI